MTRTLTQSFVLPARRRGFEIGVDYTEHGDRASAHFMLRRSDRTLEHARQRRCEIGEHVWRAGACRYCTAPRTPHLYERPRTA